MLYFTRLVYLDSAPFSPVFFFFNLQHTQAELNVFREEYMLSGEAGCLEAEPGTLERTGKVTQKELKANVASVAAAQAFDLELGDALGPYGGAWSRNGRHLLLHGRKGNLALIDAAPQR